MIRFISRRRASTNQAKLFCCRARIISSRPIRTSCSVMSTNVSMVDAVRTAEAWGQDAISPLAYLAARTSRSIPCAITLWFCGEPSSRAPGRDFVAANARDNGSWRDHVGLQHRALQKITRLPSYGTFYRPRARKVLRLLENGSSDSTKSILWFTSISRIARVRSYGGDLLGQRLAGGSGCARGPQIRAGN